MVRGAGLCGRARAAVRARLNCLRLPHEAHCSQYVLAGKVNEKTGEMSYGFASNLRDALPNTSFIGLTGTPIEKADANTRAVIGDYISIDSIPIPVSRTKGRWAQTNRDKTRPFAAVS